MAKNTHTFTPVVTSPQVDAYIEAMKYSGRTFIYDIETTATGAQTLIIVCERA